MLNFLLGVLPVLLQPGGNPPSVVRMDVGNIYDDDDSQWIDESENIQEETYDSMEHFDGFDKLPPIPKRQDDAPPPIPRKTHPVCIKIQKIQ